MSYATQYGLPDQNRPDVEKDTRYVLDYLCAIHKRWSGWCATGTGSNARDVNTGGTKTIYGNHAEIAKMRDFVYGLLDALEYKRVHSMDSADAANPKTQRAVHFVMPKYAMKYFDMLADMLYDRDSEVSVTALDSESTDSGIWQQETAKSRIRMAHNPKFRAQAEAMGQVDKIQLPADHPQSLAEYEEWGGDNIKIAASMAVKMAIDGNLSLVDYYEKIRPLIARELIATGLVVIAHPMNARGYAVPTVIPYEDAVLPETNDNWTKPQWMGFTRDMVLGQIASEAGEYISKEDYKWIGDHQRGLAGGPKAVWGTNDPLKGMKVFTGYFMDVNHYTVGKDADGYWVRVGPGDDRSLFSEVRERPYEVVYQGSFIVGSEGRGKGADGKPKPPIHWACGPAENQQRSQANLYSTRIPMVAKAYHMNKMKVRPLAQVVHDHYHIIVKAHLEIENLLNHIIPPGMVIDPTFLDGVFGDGGKQASRPDLLQTGRDTGIWFVNFKNPDDPEGPMISRPVELTGGFIPEFERLSGLILNQLDMLERVIGFNEGTNAATTQERSAAHNVQMQAQATARALSYMFKTQDLAEQELFYGMYGMMQNAYRGGRPMAEYVQLYGSKLPQLVSLTAGNDCKSIGLKVSVSMSREERDRINQALEAAMANGEITSDDYVYIYGLRDMNMKARVLKTRRMERAKQQQDNQMALVQQQGQQNAQAVQMGAEATMARAKAQADAMLAKEQMRTEADTAKFQMQLQDNQMQVSAQMQADMMKIARQMEASLELLDRKIEGQKEIDAANNATKERIASDSNETKEEVAEKAARARENAPKPD